jgi:hypothetical protein
LPFDNITYADERLLMKPILRRFIILQPIRHAIFDICRRRAISPLSLAWLITRWRLIMLSFFTPALFAHDTPVSGAAAVFSFRQPAFLRHFAFRRRYCISSIRRVRLIAITLYALAPTLFSRLIFSPLFIID